MKVPLQLQPLYSPVRYGLRIRLNTSISNIVQSIPSKMPICDPIPRDNNIRKNIIDQNGAPGSSTMACVNTMNASPVPSAACNKIMISEKVAYHKKSATRC